MAIQGASPIEPIAVIGLIQFRGTNRAKIGHGFGGILTCVTRKIHDAPSARERDRVRCLGGTQVSD